MQRILTTLLLTGIAPVAGAHTLDASAGVFAALGHELAGLHHLPFTLLLVAIGIALIFGWRRRTN